MGACCELAGVERGSAGPGIRVETDGDNSLRENCHSLAKHTMTIITNCHETLNRL